MTTTSDTWLKVHDQYVETLLHKVRLLAERRIERQSANGTNDEANANAGSVERHDERLGEFERELMTLGSPPSLRLLQTSAALSERELSLVVAAFAYEVDDQLGVLIGSADEPRPVSASVAAGLFGPEDSPADWLVHPSSPLHRFRLVAHPSSRQPTVHAPIRLEPRTVQYLLGSNQPSPQLAGVTDVLEVPTLFGRQRDLADRLATWIRDLAGGHRINLIGEPDQGRSAVAAGVAQAMGMLTLRVDIERLVPRSDRLDLVRLAVREALLLPAALYVDAPSVGDDPTRDVANVEMVEELDGLVFVGSRERWNDAAGTVAEVPRLNPSERADVWRVELGVQEASSIDLDRVAMQFSIGPGDIRKAVSEMRARLEIGGRQEADTSELWATCRSFVGSELGALAQRIEPVATWSRLVLPQRELDLLHQLHVQVDHRAVVYEEWGMGELLNRGRGVSALFTGPPGTGKTMAAEIIANDLELELYRIDLSSVVSKYIGETEKNLRKVFDAADQGGAILFFDEADALFGKRTEVRDSHDRHANVEINYLLQRMEDYAGLAILATNRKGDLDPAFLRRLRFIVSFPFPRPEYRRRIWETVLPDALPRMPLDLDALSRLEIAGGNIRNVAVNAAFMAAADGEPLAMKHLVSAAGHEYDKLDKLPTRSEFGDYYDEVKP